MATHPFDRAIGLTAAAEQPNTWHGHSSPDYWNMVGPFGGTTAATALQAVLQHPALLGEPIALTVNYAAAMGEGPFTVVAEPVRTNRSTQHWRISLMQDTSGEAIMTATAVTAARRETWGVNDMPMPAVSPPDGLPRLQFSTSAWTQRYDMRAVRGMIPRDWNGACQGGDRPEEASLTQLWVRDDPPRPLDFCALTAMSDAFYPRVWLRRAVRVPAGTVSITTYFHASSQQLAACGDGYLLAQARGQVFNNGFFDQTAQICSAAGTLLATSSQMVYYKE
ncbi:thioesterase family protein [Polaromonas sp. YR568]|uniref:acyl-CoA thioesterase n=1 Tax=Polaromonas sp. YR568 TaxID=1855301 RepID=UPI003137885B